MDMLIALYRLPTPLAAPDGVTLRKPLGCEHRAVVEWVEREFGTRWASEAGVALANRPATLWLALQHGDVVGFACHDATACGMFGPVGVAAHVRSSGIGRALLLACLHDMRAAGYAYAIAGSVGAAEFFRRCAGAVEIADSSPGLYEGMVRASSLRADC